MINEIQKLNILEIENVLKIMSSMHVTSFHKRSVEIENIVVAGCISEKENGFYIEIGFTFKSENVETTEPETDKFNLTSEQTEKLISDYEDFIRQYESLKDDNY